MPKRRQIFEVFTKAELVAIARDFGFKGWAVLNKNDIVTRLTRNGAIGIDEVLNYLGYSDLISLCSKLGLDTSGRSKKILMDRIQGLDTTPPRSKRPKSVEKKKTNQVTSRTRTQKPKMASNGNDIEKRLWSAADKLWANTGLKPSEFSTPVLGLIFLRYAESKFKNVKTELRENASRRWRVQEDQTAYQAKGAIYLPDKARFSYLQQLPEEENIGKAINDAMKLIEERNEDLRGVLPKNYNQIKDWTLVELLKLLGPVEIDGDAFGKVYEYFLGNFAMAEGRKGGVFYTPTSIVRLPYRHSR